MKNLLFIAALFLALSAYSQSGEVADVFKSSPQASPPDPSRWGDGSFYRSTDGNWYHSVSGSWVLWQGGSMAASEIEAALDAYYGNTDWRTQNPTLTGSQIEGLLDAYYGNTDWRTGSGSGIASLIEDTTPQLGGELDGQGNTLNNLGTTFWLSALDGVTRMFVAFGNINSVGHFYMGEFGGGPQLFNDVENGTGWGFTQLSGSGTRMVVADPDGYLSTQSIPAGGGSMTGTEIVTAIDSELGNPDWKTPGTELVPITQDDYDLLSTSEKQAADYLIVTDQTGSAGSGFDPTLNQTISGVYSFSALPQITATVQEISDAPSTAPINKAYFEAATVDASAINLSGDITLGAADAFRIYDNAGANQDVTVTISNEAYESGMVFIFVQQHPTYKIRIIAESGLTLLNYKETGTQFEHVILRANSANQLYFVSNFGVDITPDTTPPDTPTNLTSTAQDLTSITLAWDAALDNVGGSGVAGYRIYINGANPIDVGDVLTAQITSLTEDTSYNFTVSSIDNDGNESDQSAIYTASTDAPIYGTNPNVATGTERIPSGFAWNFQDNGEANVAPSGSTLGTVVSVVADSSGYADYRLRVEADGGDGDNDRALFALAGLPFSQDMTVAISYKAKGDYALIQVAGETINLIGDENERLLIVNLNSSAQSLNVYPISSSGNGNGANGDYIEFNISLIQP